MAILPLVLETPETGCSERSKEIRLRCRTTKDGLCGSFILPKIKKLAPKNPLLPMQQRA